MSTQNPPVTADVALDYDKAHIWHPYSAIGAGHAIYPVASADGVRIRLEDGRELIDGMSSWWSVIHGYNHPQLNSAIEQQLGNMSHVMFGGLTHQPAIALAQKLVEITPPTLQTVFFADSGSVAVEVAMKMAIQYSHDKGQASKQHFLTIKKGYHGDTFGAMSVCDPVTGMHGLFGQTLTKQFFVEAPSANFNQALSTEQLAQELAPMRLTLESSADKIAAVILEPIVQGAGGMRFYSADYLIGVRQLCDEFDVLLILDEIATGFGRSGKLFACEYANIEPDIMCVGKALTGGYMSLAATLTSEKVSQTISNGEPGLFMHGPTFMANPLACAVSLASINLLLSSNWQEKVSKIESWLKQGLAACSELEAVHEVRVLGAIGVVELKDSVDMKQIQPMFVAEGVWVRPFGKLVYVMPPYIIEQSDIKQLCMAIRKVISHYHCH